ncbi:MAG: thioredoxin fold domain-containing protein [Pseudomonadota bacterium]
MSGHARLTRRRWLALVAALPAAARAQETALPRPASLPAEAQAAAARGAPLVLLVSLPGCPYCERIRRGYLTPLAREHGRGVVQIDLGSTQPLVDFDGATRTHDAFARARNATFTPTVLFLGPRGAEIAERLVGAGVPDFYGAYFEQRLDTARQALSGRS